MIEYKTNPVKAIRDKCIDCCCGSFTEVKECAVESCPLFPYRLGKNPFRQRREMSDEAREVLLHRLEEARKHITGSEKVFDDTEDT